LNVIALSLIYSLTVVSHWMCWCVHQPKWINFFNKALLSSGKLSRTERSFMSDESTGWVQKAEADYQNARILLRQRKTFLPDNI